MEYRLSDSDRELIRVTEREVFLALVLDSGDVRLKIAEADLYPGHIDWIHHDQIAKERIVCGFSFIVKGGQVTGLFASSQLNQTSDWRLEEQQLNSILKLLPVSSGFRLY